jgi:hypothetical protein
MLIFSTRTREVLKKKLLDLITFFVVSCFTWFVSCTDPSYAAPQLLSPTPFACVVDLRVPRAKSAIPIIIRNPPRMGDSLHQKFKLKFDPKDLRNCNSYSEYEKKQLKFKSRLSKEEVELQQQFALEAGNRINNRSLPTKKWIPNEACIYIWTIDFQDGRPLFSYIGESQSAVRRVLGDEFVALSEQRFYQNLHFQALFTEASLSPTAVVKIEILKIGKDLRNPFVRRKIESEYIAKLKAGKLQKEYPEYFDNEDVDVVVVNLMENWNLIRELPPIYYLVPNFNYEKFIRGQLKYNGFKQTDPLPFHVKLAFRCRYMSKVVELFNSMRKNNTLMVYFH